MKTTLVFPNERINGIYRSAYAKEYRPNDTIQFYHNGKLHVEAFREKYFEEDGSISIFIFLRRSTGDMGALRYKWVFLFNLISLAILTAMAVIGTFQARVVNYDKPEHALIFAMVMGVLMFLSPAYTVIKYCLYPEPREFSRWYHRDV